MFFWVAFFQVIDQGFALHGEGQLQEFNKFTGLHSQFVEAGGNFQPQNAGMDLGWRRKSARRQCEKLLHLGIELGLAESNP